LNDTTFLRHPIDAIPTVGRFPADIGPLLFEYGDPHPKLIEKQGYAIRGHQLNQTGTATGANRAWHMKFSRLRRAVRFLELGSLA